MTDFPSSNETFATSTNLGFISRYSVGASINAIRNDSINTPPPSSTDKYDYFTFRHTKGLTHVYITLTLESSVSSTYYQALNLDLLNGFASTPGVQIYDYGGIPTPPNSNPATQIHTTTKTFLVRVSPNSTQSYFVLSGLHEIGASLSYTDLQYSFRVQVAREFDLRDKTVGTNASETLVGTNHDDVILARGGNDTVRGLGRNDDIRGDAGNDRLYGDSGHDRINGGSGHDFIVGGTGNDILLGGSGNDRAYGQSGNDFIRGGTGRDLLSGGNNNDQLFGDSDNDRIYGGSGRDFIRGGTGNDYILGGADNDRIFGDSGVDRIGGDAGDDIIYGGSENDLIRGGNGNDTIHGNGDNDRIFGDNHNDMLYGDAGADIIYGGSGLDYLFGGIGADYLDGGADNDTIDPGADLDADTIIGGDGSDTVDYSNATGQVFVFLRDNFSSGAAANDTYDGVENVIGTIYGDGLQNANGGTAYGGGGNDTLYGGGNFDGGGDGGIIRGDTGNDTLNMRYGDTKAWVQNGYGSDTIDYFVEGQDKIFVKLSDFNLGTSLSSSELINSTTVTKVGSNPQFIFEGDALRLWFDPDGAGAQPTVLIATFTNSTFDEASTSSKMLDTGDFDWIL